MKITKFLLLLGVVCLRNVLPATPSSFPTPVPTAPKSVPPTTIPSFAPTDKAAALAIVATPSITPNETE